MKLFEKLRYYFFWIIDVLTGGKVKSHYNDVKFILEHYNTEESQQKRAEYLQNVLKHATHTTGFYKDYKNNKLITDFPVVNKAFIKSHVDDLVSKEYVNKQKIKIQTSGSSGTPFTVYIDENKKKRNTADTIYFSKKTGYELGQKLFYFRAWNSKKFKTKLKALIQNIKKINVLFLDDVAIDKLLKDLQKEKSDIAILCYTSTIRDICKYLDKTHSEPIQVNISSFIANAEPLDDYTKRAVKKHFNCDVYSRYSNMENGMLSHQIPNEGHDFHINWASYYIEILKVHNDNPASYGELGRVVVTDLFNYNMPMIRYDTGDLAIMKSNSNAFNGAPSLVHVEGRKMDTIYTTQGRAISAVVYELDEFDELKEFQLIQENKTTYRVIASLNQEFNREKIVIQKLKNHLGQDAIINLVYVNDIPKMSSGKRKLTINETISQ